MKVSEFIDMQGRLTLQRRNRANEMLEEIVVNNDIVLTGRDLVAKLFLHESIAPISHIAVGTGTKPVDPINDIALANELSRKVLNPVDLTKDLITKSENRKQVTIKAELDFNDANGPLTEAGLFNAVTGGVMYNRVIFPAINKTTDFKLTLIWDILF